MKTLLLSLLLFLLCAIEIQAQSVYGPGIEFSYTNAGHRVKREYNPYTLLNKHGKAIDINSPSDTIKLTDTRRYVTIKAYPNPTNGMLTIENPNWTKTINTRVEVLDIVGKLLLSINVNNTTMYVELTSFATGTYMVNYYQNNHLLNNWKIIKQ